ncbi:MAG: ATP-binding protein [Rhodospirillaceae bacterium]|nr:ATP-binding protein [Rhodospirillaceae bacterium]MBL6929911.1 ATP-binding protein [Rhodospirillales bacterium]MBL6942607.1 ATP-binding protein [Rhodospirillales bacterium]
MENKPVLHLVCGKIASGKSTLAQKLAAQPGTILFSEDQWLSGLYPEEMKSVQDYVKYSARLRPLIGQHIQSLLQQGLSVVMDFPANTLEFRLWMRGIFENTGIAHELHFLDVPDTLCKDRLHRRNKDGHHAFAPSEADFDLISSYFVPPTPKEGFNIIVHTQETS